MKRILSIFTSISILMAVAACASVEMTATYIDPEVSPDLEYEKVFVSSMFANEAARTILEDEIESKLEDRNTPTTTSHELFPESETGFKFNKEEVYQKISSDKNDAILTMSVISEGSQTRFIPTDGVVYTPVAMNPWFSSYWTYYSNMGQVVYRPGYYTQTKTYFIEANLYDVESDELVWSAQTETYAAADIENLAESLADLVIRELEDEKLLKEADEA